MARKSSSPVKYVLIGARKGQSGTFHSVEFKDGVAVVDAQYHQEAGHVLEEHYSAFPADEAEAAEAKWQAEQDACNAAAKAKKDGDLEAVASAIDKIQAGRKAAE